MKYADAGGAAILKNIFLVENQKESVDFDR